MNALTERLGRSPFINNEDKRKINLLTSKKKENNENFSNSRRLEKAS